MRPVPDAAITLIKHFEGFSPTAYRDAAGFLTIGYGHLVRDGDDLSFTLTEAQADALLRQDITIAARSVLRLVTVPLSDGQYGALVSFRFNLGGGALQRSTLRAKLNREEYREAADQFRYWVWAGGKRLRGLVRRREAERQMFMQARVPAGSMPQP
jgi:lysozyme